MISTRRSSPARFAAIALSLIAAGWAVAGPSGPTAAEAGQSYANPANHPKLINRPIEPFRYDRARQCRNKLTRGLVRLRGWVDRHYPGDYWGGIRCESLGSGGKSLHSEGRALDWRLDAGRKRERRAAWRLIRMLLATDRNGQPQALARRMGVQEIIFACRSWYSGSPGMRRYSACHKGVDRTTAHRDHIHIGINRRAAKARTSFWTSPLWRR